MRTWWPHETQPFSKRQSRTNEARESGLFSWHTNLNQKNRGKEMTSQTDEALSKYLLSLGRLNALRMSISVVIYLLVGLLLVPYESEPKITEYLDPALKFFSTLHFYLALGIPIFLLGLIHAAKEAFSRFYVVDKKIDRLIDEIASEISKIPTLFGGVVCSSALLICFHLIHVKKWTEFTMWTFIFIALVAGFWLIACFLDFLYSNEGKPLKKAFCKDQAAEQHHEQN
jgi:hypothetical protein